MNLSKQQAKALADKLHYEQEQAGKLQYDQWLKNKKHPDFIAFIKSKQAECLAKIRYLFTHSIVREVRFTIKSSMRDYDYDITLYRGDASTMPDKINKKIVEACRYNRRYNFGQIENAIILATIDCETTDKLIAQVKKQLSMK